jgi:hypothetical protein
MPGELSTFASKYSILHLEGARGSTSTAVYEILKIALPLGLQRFTKGRDIVSIIV